VISDQLSVISNPLLARSVRSVGLLLFLICCFAVSATAATFDEQRKVVAASPATQPEASIISMLKAGIDEGKPALAIAEAQKWLHQNMPEDGMLLYYAGRAAELSGDWKGAAALYQQYLKKADLKSATADEAVYATYTLLIDYLSDTSGAYAFGRNDGSRLMACPRARQFDQWFLDEAVRRDDATAVAQRLQACIESGLPGDLLVARYDNYFRWLLSKYDGYCDHTVRVTQEAYDAVKGLTSVMTFEEELKLKLDWAISVMSYNQAMIGDKAKGKAVIRISGKGKGFNITTGTAAAGKKQPGKKGPDAKAVVAQAVEEKKLEFGDAAAPPIAEASALLEKFPQFAKWVQTGWAGGGNGQHYRNDPKNYWPHEIEAKMAPVVAAAAKLTPVQLAELLQSWGERYYSDNVVRPLNVKVVRDYLLANPDLMKGKGGILILEKQWQQYTPEEAQKLAPQLAESRHYEASIIRAIAAGGKERDFDKVMASIRGPEFWRFNAEDRISQLTDTLWHYCNRLGGNQKRDAEIAKSRELEKTMDIQEVQAGSQPAQRIAVFTKLLADYRSPQPKIPGVYSQLAKVLQFTPEVIPELLKDQSPEAQMLARDAIESGMTGPDQMWKELDWLRNLRTGSYEPLMMAYVQRHGGMQQAKQRFPGKCRPYPLEGVFRQSIAEGLKQNKVESWQVIAWVNMQWPEDNAEQVKLVQSLVKSPAWKTLPFEAQFAAREWFNKDAMTPGQISWMDAGDPQFICKDLQSLTNTSDVATTAAALGKAIDGARKSPVKITFEGLDRLASVSEGVFADPKVIELVLELTDGMRYVGTSERQPFVDRLLAYVDKKREPLLVHRTAACLWSYASRAPYGRQYQQMKGMTESLLDQHPAAAYAIACTGLEMLNRSRGAYGFNVAASIPEMKALLGKAAMKMGLVAIPVAKTDPTYPIYKSQADWMGGNEDSAWTLCSDNWTQLMHLHRELSMEYLMWVLQRTIYSRDERRQEELVKALLAWEKEPNSPLSPAQKVQLELAYGDIAVQRGMLKEAGEIFKRTAENKEYDGLLIQHEATLRRVRVQRMAKEFDAALQTLTELEMKRVPEMWAPTRYARAEVYYDMEEYDNSAEDVESILAREPTHAEAKIMQGKLQLKRQKLMEATEVELGTVSSQQALVPGEKLKVTLSDPTLAVSGAGTEIEVVVWSKSGDREHFFLRQFGDQKTKFRGEVATALGAPKPDDRILQVIGDDEIYYAYSERFRKKMNNMDEKRGGPITVASDALLMASARKLLSESEQRVADMEAQMAELNKQGGSKTIARATVQARMAGDAGRGAMTGESMEEMEARERKELQKRLLAQRVKPGNPIYIRVIDPDRSRTAQIDDLTVSVESSSGDSIGEVSLKETGPYTGWFEGSVPTAGAQAMAFAKNTEAGRNPNMVLSTNAAYPAWRPEAGKGASPEFTVDLNDNVSLGEMTITAKEQGSKLKKFILFTGMNAKEMNAVAAYPKSIIALKEPWRPSVTIMNDTDYHHNQNLRSVYDIRELEHQLDRGWMSQQFAAGITENVAGPSVAMTNSIPDKVKWVRNNQHHNAHVIYRFRGYFYEPADVSRHFMVELGKWVPPEVHPSVANPAQYMISVDGRIISERKEKPLEGGAAVVLEGKTYLRQGVHTFEIWSTGWDCRIGFGRTVKLLANLADPDALSACPDSFFDPDKFPRDLVTHRNGAATINANSDGIEFSVKFAPESRTRLFTLVLVEQEGPVPALNKIALTDTAGKRILPVPRDYAALNKNNILEILTGDKVAVRYVDDRYVTREKEKHERSLNVSFTSARMQFEFFENRKDNNGDEFEYYEKLLRFIHGKPLLLTVTDADMDVSSGQDKVNVTVGSRTGGKRQFVATESANEPGTFRVKIIPVTGTPADNTQIQAEEGGTLTAIYRDEENTDPGVPVDRYASTIHAAYKTPQLILSHATVTPLSPTNLPGARVLDEGFHRIEEQDVTRTKSFEHKQRVSSGAVRPRWAVSNDMINVASPPVRGFDAVEGLTMMIELEAPNLALRVGSTVDLYVQTDAGRKQVQAASTPQAAPAFDITAPGTMRLNAALNMTPGIRKEGWRETPRIPIYVAGQTTRRDQSTVERFTCDVPLIAGMLPDHGVLSDEEIAKRRKLGLPPDPAGLVVRPGERVYVGYHYEDRNGTGQWATASAKVISHPVLDVMEEDYRTAKTTSYVGESLYIRVVDLGADVSDRSDTVKVLMQAKSGAKYEVELNEVDTHSGVFKGVYQLSYLKTGSKTSTNTVEYDVKAEGFPVVYGDTVGARYTDANGVKTDTMLVGICRGADGKIEPFSKKYDDPEIAMRTQFTMAESYLEVAKHHRDLGEPEAAAREYERAKQMLAGAMDQFRDPETRAHAEYLLGNLTLEEADSTAERELKETRFRAALSRFMNVTGTYPNTLHASKAQFKIATVYEKLKEPDIAAQEYVKLAYKYPDSEFLAVAMARLGTHFQRKAVEYENQAKPLLEKTGDKNAQDEGTARKKMAAREYLKSANIFARLQERFPDHELAGQAGLRAGQAFMRAGENRQALKAFLKVVDKENYDGPEIRAQAMYWAGMCYENLKEAMAAYSIYKRLTYDFPESKWASYARAQLSQEKLLNLENDLEIKRLEEGR